MQFSSVVLFAGVAMATYTSYITEIITKTHCPAYYTDCPAESTKVHTHSYPAPIASGSPAPYSNGTAPAPAHSAPYGTGAAPQAITTVTINACPSTAVAPITSVVVPYPAGTGTPPAAAGTAPAAVGTVTPPSVASTTPAPYTGAGAHIKGSFALVGLAGLAALILA